VVARAQAVKAEFADIENLRIKLENKDEAIKDFKRQLRLKVSFDFPIQATDRNFIDFLDFSKRRSVSSR
jgi:hypothetical protein